MIENFEKVLEYFDKESIIEIVDRFNLPKAGKKLKHIEIILKNSTILEYAIRQLVTGAYKDDLIDIAKDLGIESNATGSQLKQQILDKLNKTINAEDIQNKIKFLDVCFEKDDLFEILEEYNLPKAGKKLKLMELIAKNDSMMEFAMNYWKNESYKEDIEDVCDRLGIDYEGNKEKLLQRVHDYLFKKETRINVNKESVEKKYQMKNESSKNIDEISEEDLQNNFSNYDPYQMEELVGKLFEKKDYQVDITKKSGDFGIDVWANSSIERIGIQVKHQEHDVGYDAIAKTIGSAMTSTKIIIISTKSSFTKPCYEYQMDHPQFVKLWKSEKLKEEIRRHMLS